MVTKKEENKSNERQVKEIVFNMESELGPSLQQLDEILW